MKPNQLNIITNPHGAQTVIPVPGNDGLSVGNSLFLILDIVNNKTITMTGEELTDLSNQWLNFVKKNS